MTHLSSARWRERSRGNVRLPLVLISRRLLGQLGSIVVATLEDNAPSARYAVYEAVLLRDPAATSSRRDRASEAPACRSPGRDSAGTPQSAARSGGRPVGRAESNTGSLPRPAGRTRWRPGGAHGSRPLGDLPVDEVGVDDVTRFDAGYRVAQAFRVSRRVQ